MAESDRRPVCAVVGVGPGLGAALARRFATEYAVALVARGEDKLVSLAKEIENAGGKALPVSADVAKAADITGAFDQIRRELGDVDALLYNAAMRPFGKLMDTKPSTFENTWRVTTFGAFLAAQEVVPAMLKRGSGVIIFTGATAGIAIRERFPQITEDAMLKPAAIAETYWHLAHQDRSAWSHDVDVRPFKEKW